MSIYGTRGPFSSCRPVSSPPQKFTFRSLSKAADDDVPPQLPTSQPPKFSISCATDSDSSPIEGEQKVTSAALRQNDSFVCLPATADCNRKASSSRLASLVPNFCASPLDDSPPLSCNFNQNTQSDHQSKIALSQCSSAARTSQPTSVITTTVFAKAVQKPEAKLACEPKVVSWQSSLLSSKSGKSAEVSSESGGASKWSRVPSGSSVAESTPCPPVFSSVKRVPSELLPPRPLPSTLKHPKPAMIKESSNLQPLPKCQFPTVPSFTQWSNRPSGQKSAMFGEATEGSVNSSDSGLSATASSGRKQLDFANKCDIPAPSNRIDAEKCHRSSDSSDLEERDSGIDEHWALFEP